MTKKYKFTYNRSARVMLEVDSEKFTTDMANFTLNFFSWNYDRTADEIDEVMKKYALEVIAIATFENLNTAAVIKAFNNVEGFLPIDGTHGIRLIRCTEYELVEEELDVMII